MTPLAILILALNTITPYCDARVHVVEIPPEEGMIIYGEYKDGIIMIDRWIPKHEIEQTALHECAHELWSKKTKKEKSRIANRLRDEKKIYSDTIEEEWAERWAINLLTF